MNFVSDNLGEPVPEETFTHSHLSWSLIVPCLLHPSTTIHGILPVQSIRLTVFPQSLSKLSFVYLLARHSPLHTPHISSPNHCLLFATHAPTIATCQWFNIPGTDPKSPVFPQSISSYVIIDITLHLAQGCATLWLGFPPPVCIGMWGAPTGWYPNVVSLFAIFSTFWCKMKITQADAPTIRMDCHPIQTNWCSHFCHSHQFYGSCLPGTTLPIYPGSGQAPNMLACIPSGLQVDLGTATICCRR